MYYLGIDLGGTNIVVGLVDKDGKLIYKDSVSTFKERPNEEIIDDMATLCLNVIKKNNLTKDEIISIGIGSPGTCNPKDGIIIKAYNLGFNNLNIGKMIEDKVGIKTFVENDANCAAFGEFQVGAGRAYKSAVVITIGTGLGCGLILNGDVISGSFYGGGEFGHSVLTVNGRQCTCGRKGCWEAYCSATAIIEETKKQAKANPQSKINEIINNNLDNITAKTPFDAALLGDEVGKSVVDEFILYLAEGMVNIINGIEPEIIVLGGGVSAQGEVLTKPLIKLVNEKSFGGTTKTKIGIATLGNDAGIIGAALLGLNE